MALTHGLGYRCDPADLLVREYTPKLGAASSLPPSVNLTGKLCTALDQGATSSCTGHGTAIALLVCLGWLPSPDGIYRVGLCVARDGVFTRIVDEGACPSDIVEGLCKWGVRPMGPCVDGRHSDCSADTIDAEPTLAELEQDARHLVVGMSRVYTTGQARVLALCTALAAGHVVGFAAYVDEAYERYRPGTQYAPPKGQANHWQALVGYRTDAQGRIVWLVRNSWGATWGDAGNAEWAPGTEQAWQDVTIFDAKEVQK